MVVIDTRGMLTTSQVAAMLNVHPATIRRWERDGIIEPTLRQRGRRLYTLDAVKAIESRVFDVPEQTNDH
jgi:predicted site-specific integrase-resolvase